MTSLEQSLAEIPAFAPIHAHLLVLVSQAQSSLSVLKNMALVPSLIWP